MSSARLYVEYKGAFFNDYNTSVPAAVSVFPEEVYQAPRGWTERAYRNLIHFNELPKGGHFTAWEQPQLFSEEVRTLLLDVGTGAGDVALLVADLLGESGEVGTASAHFRHRQHASSGRI